MDTLKIKVDKDQEVYITSDYHYGQKNIVKGVSSWSDKEIACRDFKNIPEMNFHIVNETNKLVKPNDWLIFLGDWSFGGIQNTWEFRKKLMVKNIVFVAGNHDHHIYPKPKRIYISEQDINIAKNLNIPVHYYDDFGSNTQPYVLTQQLFSYVFPYVQLKVQFSNHTYTVDLNHKPLLSWEKIGKGRVHLHGHVHNKGKDIFMHPGRSMDIGCEGNNFKPYKFKTVVEEVYKRPISVFKKDHH